MINEIDLLKARLTLNKLLGGYLKKHKANPTETTEKLKNDLLETYSTFSNLSAQYQEQSSLNWSLMMELERLELENKKLKNENKNLYEGL